MSLSAAIAILKDTKFFIEIQSSSDLMLSCKLAFRFQKIAIFFVPKPVVYI
jgi:hypothetical protein